MAIRILVAEDDNTLRNVIMEMLKHLGYEVEGYPDGQTAKTRIESSTFTSDLVLTDRNMPEIDGLDVAATSAQLGIPCILMSGRPEPKKHHAKAFIQKPFGMRDIDRLIKQII